MKARHIYWAISHKSGLFPGRIIIITGARQAGKTTLVKNTFLESRYIAADDPVVIDQYTSLTAQQWKESYPDAILDEIQKTPVLIDSIKNAFETFPDSGYVLTGSSQSPLLGKLRETLADRCTVFELFPLTIPEMMTDKWDDEIRVSFFQEFLQNGFLPGFLPSFLMYPDYAIREKTFQHYCSNGGFPHLTRASMKENDRFEWLTNYLRTYLDYDIRDLADFRSSETFVRIMRMSALLTGTLLNYAEIAKDAGITPSTAKRFVNFLELGYQVFLLQPWSRNIRKRLVKSPKLHYLDPGVQRAVIQKRGIQSGNEYASAVISEIYKQVKSIEFGASINHLCTVDGREVDILIETDNGYYAIKVKMTSHMTDVDAKHLKGLGEILDKPLIQSFLLSNDPSVRFISDKILALPAAMFLS